MKKLIDEIEHLAERMVSLREAEELAVEAFPQMVPELRRLHYASIEACLRLSKKLLRGRLQLGARGPQVSLEVAERLFIVLRDQAEMEWNRSLKATGPEVRRSKKKADQFARLARQAALSLKIIAESKGIWTDQYISEHGLDAWL